MIKWFIQNFVLQIEFRRRFCSGGGCERQETDAFQLNVSMALSEDVAERNDDCEAGRYVRETISLSRRWTGDVKSSTWRCLKMVETFENGCTDVVDDADVRSRSFRAIRRCRLQRDQTSKHTTAKTLGKDRERERWIIQRIRRRRG